MTETPIVVTRTRRGEASQRSFAFRANQIPASPTGALQTYRQQAWDAFQRLPLPLTTDEAWRRTDLRGLQVESFRLPEAGAYQSLLPVPDSLLEPVAGGTHAGQVLLYPGGARVSLDPALAQKGVVFMDLASAEVQQTQLLERLLGQVVKPEEGKFAALAAALGSSGVLLYVPRGVQIEQPLHSLVWGPGVGLAHLTHVLVWLEEGAAATFVHEYASADEDGGQTLHCGIVEVHVGEGANLRFVELQSWGRHVWNFTQERVVVAGGGQLDWVFGAIGSRLTKNFSDLNLAGSGAVGRMSGFYFTDGEQHLDHDTQQNHLAAHTTSDLLFKGALEDASRSVWQGMIYVAPEAQKTDGYQSNRNLVLSRAARADSIPGLEILADDVRCTHGATVGKIDQDQVFYLRSRGIPDEDARRLIVEGFFDPIMQRIPFEGVRQRFQAAIQHKMKQANGPESV